METPNLEGYGFGWLVATSTRGTTWTSHTGLLLPEGWNANFRRFAADSVSIVVLSNRYVEDALSDIVTRSVTRLIFGGRVDVPPLSTSNPRGCEVIAGLYRDRSSAEIQVDFDGTALTVSPSNQRAVNMIRLGRASDSARFADVDSMSAAVLNAVWRDSLALVAGLLNTARTFARWQSDLQATRDALVSRFGKARKWYVLYTVEADPETGLLSTFANTVFDTVAVATRLTWQKGKLIGASDAGTLVGKSPGVEVVPGARRLVPQGNCAFATFDFASATSRFWHAGPDGTLILNLETEPISFKRIDASRAPAR
jgi:hypothetical protein